MQFFDVFTIALFASFAAARPQATDNRHGWCQCVRQGTDTINVPATREACDIISNQEGINAQFDPSEARCWTDGSQIPGREFNEICISQGDFQSRCS